MKVILWFFIAFVFCAAFGAWTTFDYSLDCTKCLAAQHVVEEQLFGITVSRTIKNAELAADYERIFGHPCDHVFRKGGFGRGWHSILGSGVGCGVTGEGFFFRPRLEAVSATYDAERRLHQRDLTLATFQLIDTLMPPAIQVRQRHDMNVSGRDMCSLLGSFLQRARTVEQWRAVLVAARQNFSNTSNLPN